MRPAPVNDFADSDFLPEQQEPDSGINNDFPDLNCGRNLHGLCILALTEYCYNNNCPLNFAGAPG